MERGFPIRFPILLVASAAVLGWVAAALVAVVVGLAVAEVGAGALGAGTETAP
jgi:hypothetical protein